MKLRIRENSLRLRVTRSELEKLALTGWIEERVQIGVRHGDALSYRLELTEGLARPAVDFTNSRICVRLPFSEGMIWTQSETVGLYGEEAWGLSLAIEKDFKCLVPHADENDADAFEHPGISGSPCGAESISLKN